MGYFKELSIEAEEQNTTPETLIFWKIANTETETKKEIEEFISAVLPDIAEKYILQIDKSNLIFKSRKKYISALSVLSDIKKNLYYIPATFEGWRVDDEALHKQALFVDIDEIDIDLSQTPEQIKKELFEKFPRIKRIIPSYIVKSGHGLHLYWKMKSPFYLRDFDQLDNFKTTTQNLIAYFEGDITCTNSSRIMRLPGSYNCKEEITKSEIIFKGETEFSFSDFDGIFDDIDFYEYKAQKDAERNEKRLATMAANGTKPGRKKKDNHEKISFDLYLYDEQDTQAPEIVEGKGEAVPQPQNKNETKQQNHNPKSRQKRVLNDLQIYYDRRRGKIEGHRALFVFMICNTYKQMKKSQEEATAHIMRYFAGDEFEEEALEKIESIFRNKKIYNYTNQKIAEIMEYTENDIAEMSLAYTTEQTKKQRQENHRREAERRKERRGVAEKKKKQIETIKQNPEKTNKELAEMLGTSTKTIQRIKTKINAE